jgi:hypothetical protein
MFSFRLVLEVDHIRIRAARWVGAAGEAVGCPRCSNVRYRGVGEGGVCLEVVDYS